MDTMDTYVDVLVTSLKKKVQVLEKLDQVVLKQEKELKLPNPSLDELDTLQEQKGELIAEMELNYREVFLF